MTEQQLTHDECTCEVSAPAQVDAGTVAKVRFSWTCPHGCDLAGLTVAVSDMEGAVLATAVLAAGDDDSAATGEVLVTTPDRPGDYRFRAALVRGPEGEARPAHRSPPAEFTITAVAHTLRLNAWGLPSAVAAGEPFELKVGVKCSSACELAGRNVRLVDADGRMLAEATLGEEPWPGTAALHYATLHAVAPPDAGRHGWYVRLAASRARPPHAAATLEVPLTVVAGNDCEVVVEAVDSEEQRPIPDARVIIHPYRAVTGPDGIARLRVAPGEYRMQVSGARHMPFTQPLSVSGVVTARAELEREPPPRSPDEGYW